MKLSFTKSHLSSRIDPYRIHELIKTSLISKMRERERERERDHSKHVCLYLRWHCDGSTLEIRRDTRNPRYKTEQFIARRTPKCTRPVHLRFRPVANSRGSPVCFIVISIREIKERGFSYSEKVPCPFAVPREVTEKEACTRERIQKRGGERERERERERDAQVYA